MKSVNGEALRNVHLKVQRRETGFGLERVSEAANEGILALVVQRIMHLDHGSREMEASPCLRVRIFREKTADRKSVVSGTSVSVRVDLGGRRIIKKKKKEIEQTYHIKRSRQR